MKPIYKRTIGLAVFFLPAIMFMVVNSASAGDTVENKKAEDPVVGVSQGTPENLGDLEQRAADPKGPPYNPGPGWYVKTRGKNAGTYKYFKHGHPENQSEWDYYGPNPPPYGS